MSRQNHSSEERELSRAPWPFSAAAFLVNRLAAPASEIVDNRYSLRGQKLSDPDSPGGRTSCCGQDVANPAQHLLNRPRQTGQAGRGEFADGGAGPTQPRLGDFADGLSAGLAGHRWPAGPGEQYPWEPPRIATGVKDRVNKLKALGNAVVPAQVYPVFRAIRETEEAIT